MEDSIPIGPSPYDEPCYQVGSPEYSATAAIRECRLYIEAIKKHLGEPPSGCCLVVRGNPHDLGTYYEVEAVYDPDNVAAMEYALRCESEAPATWAEAGMPEVLAILHPEALPAPE